MTTATITAKESPERAAIINSAIERILAQPLTYPPFDLNITLIFQAVESLSRDVI
jgi:hypothetical protein